MQDFTSNLQKKFYNTVITNYNYKFYNTVIRNYNYKFYNAVTIQINYKLQVILKVMQDFTSNLQKKKFTIQ